MVYESSLKIAVLEGEVNILEGKPEVWWRSHLLDHCRKVGQNRGERGEKRCSGLIRD